MIKSIILTGIQSRVLVVSVAALLIVFGIYQLRDIPVGVFPEYSPVYVEVQTEALGLSADEIEQILTVALEQDLLNGIAFVDEIWSESMPGLSRVVCVFEPGTDPMLARQVVAEPLTQAHALPNVSKAPIMLQPYSSTSRIMKVGLSPSNEDLSLIDLSVLARWTIQPYLMGVEGVANVSIWGQRKRQLQVQVDPQRLADNGVTLHDVIKTSGEALWVSPLSFLNSSTPGTGGFFDTPNQRLGIRHLLPISTPEDLAKVSVHSHDMVLGDITEVVENHQPLIGDAIVNGEEGLLLVVEKFPWASTTKVTQNVEKALANLAPGLSGVAFDTEIYQPASFIEASFGNVSRGVGISIILAAVLFFLFFYEWRAALISTVAMMLSLIAGAYVLYARGVIFDMMVVAGFVVALGVIIDDAISTLDNIRRRLQENNGNGEKKTAAIIFNAVYETRSPIFFATCILILAALPFFFVYGIAGSFLEPLAVSYILALIVSTITALLVTPAMSMWLYSSGSWEHRESPALASLQNIFRSGVAAFTQRPVLAYVVLGVLAVIGIGLMPLTDMSLKIPIPNERDFVITWEADHGTSHTQMAKLTKEAVAKLKAVDGVHNVAAHIGRAVMSDKINNVHAGEIWLNMADDANYDATLANIKNVVGEYPDMNSKVMTYHEQSLNKSMYGVDKEYAVRVYGENQEIMTKKAEEVKEAITGINGLIDAKVEYPPMEPVLEVEVDLIKAREYNIRPGDVRRTAATLVSGIEVGSLFEGQKVFEVVVWGVPEVRKSIESVKNLLVDIPDVGGTVRIGDVAEVREVPNPAVIKREKVCRYMDVSFTMSGGSANTLQAEVNKNLLKVDFPLEYHAELVGKYEEAQIAQSRLISIALASLIMIFLLLQAAFWSWRMALVAFPSLLLAISGGMIGVLLSGGSLSIGALAGFLAILGVATQQAIMLIKRFNQLEVKEGWEFGPDLVSRGVQERLGPILMTTMITILVFLPFAIMGNVPGMEAIFPMSMVIIGGMITTLLLNLFVLPSLYLQFGKVSETLMEEEKSMLKLDVKEPVTA